MRTYISPIGYDTRRVTRPVINRGLDSEDELVLLRPGGETDTERATQTIADVEQFLQEIEPNYRQRVEHVVTDSFEETVRDCCQIVSDVGDDREIVVSLGGGARDILLPLTVAALVYARRIDAALFFSDLDNSVQEWTLPDLTARISDRAFPDVRSDRRSGRLAIALYDHGGDRTVEKYGHQARERPGIVQCRCGRHEREGETRSGHLLRRVAVFGTSSNGVIRSFVTIHPDVICLSHLDTARDCQGRYSLLSCPDA